MKSLLVLFGLTMLAVGCGDGSVNNVHPTITVTYKVECFGGDTASGLFVEHTTTYFSDATEFVECLVGGPGGTNYGSATWFQDEAGWLKSECSVNADVDSPTYGLWDFTVAGSTSGYIGLAIYTDKRSINDGYGIPMTCTRRAHPPVPSP